MTDLVLLGVATSALFARMCPRSARAVAKFRLTGLRLVLLICMWVNRPPLCSRRCLVFCKNLWGEE